MSSPTTHQTNPSSLLFISLYGRRTTVKYHEDFYSKNLTSSYSNIQSSFVQLAICLPPTSYSLQKFPHLIQPPELSLSAARQRGGDSRDSGAEVSMAGVDTQGHLVMSCPLHNRSARRRKQLQQHCCLGQYSTASLTRTAQYVSASQTRRHVTTLRCQPDSTERLIQSGPDSKVLSLQ